MDITIPKQGTINRKQEKLKWIINLENNIERIRTETAHIQVIINCKYKGKFTKVRKSSPKHHTSPTGKEIPK